MTLNPDQFPTPKRPRLRVPRPESLHDALDEIQDVRDNLMPVLIALRDKINEAHPTATGPELARLFDTSVMIERTASRLLSAERDLREAVDYLPSIRLRLNEIGMSS